MSLVERAAKRLEELRNASPQRPAELPDASSPGKEVRSSIERAVRVVQPPDSGRASSQADAPVRAMEAPGASRGGGGDRAGLGRREPRLGDALARNQAAPDTLLQPGSAANQEPGVELDLPMLTAAGYLDPKEPESAMANEFRRIKRPLIQACHGKLAAPVENANRIMVTSSVPGEGKSYFALNLALSMAMERDSTVLLIDADTTRRSLSRLIGIGSKPGLLVLLAGNQTSLTDALLRTNVDRLTLLPAGASRGHATELLASEAMEHLVEELAPRDADRIVIFDTPPLLGAPEPAVLATHMGQIIVVVEADKTTRKVLGSALATIQSCPVVTAVLNKASSSEAGYYYYAS